MTVPLMVPVPDNSAPPPPGDTPSDAESHPAPELGFELPPPAKLGRKRTLALAVAVIGILGVAFLARWLPSRHTRHALEADTKSAQTATPRVRVVAPVVVSSDRSLVLPGSVLPLEETIICPRVSGFIRKWFVDLGGKVREGDLLAEIDTPDLDQQIAQARAQLAQAEASVLAARANSRFSKENFERYAKLVPAGLATQEDLAKNKAQSEADQANITVAEAAIGSQHANLQYLMQLKSFARIVAPFNGIATSRTVERGTLVTAGTATPLFKISAIDPVRVFVQVPQDVAPSVRVGLPANVTLREYPGRTFVGTVAHAAGALDATTRTMLTEVRVPNPINELITGMYAQVSLALPRPHRALAVPPTAVLNDANGLRVAVVDGNSRVKLVPVVVERDTGPTVEISSGLAPEDRVVALPGAELTEGRLVEVVP